MNSNRFETRESHFIHAPAVSMENLLRDCALVHTSAHPVHKGLFSKYFWFPLVSFLYISYDALLFVGFHTLVDSIVLPFYKNWSPFESVSGIIYVFGILRLGSVLSFTGSYLLAFYFFDKQRLAEEFNYLGPMRIVDTDIQLDKLERDCSSHRGCSRYEGYRAKFVVEWGDAWACPGQYDDKWCVSQTEYSTCTRTICNSQTCNDEQRDLTRVEVQQCLGSIHPNVSLVSDGYSFPREQPPWEDVGWPTVVLYGKCTDCIAVEGVGYDDLTSMYAFGIVILPTGVFFVLTSGLYILYWWAKGPTTVIAPIQSVDIQ